MKIVISILLMVTIAGCGMRGKSTDPTMLSEVQPIEAVQTLNVELSKKKFDAALGLGDPVNTLRVVQVYRRGDGSLSSAPEYRLFEIQKKSVFDLMGLQNADILQAANGRIVYKPEGFAIFVRQVMRTMVEADVNISRSGVPMLYKYRFVE